MNKFNIGDRVKRITEDHCGCCVGDIHTVRDYDRPNNLRLEGFPSDVVFMESKFELVKEEETNKMPELQTGNRVELRNGDICLVVKDQDRFYSKQYGFFNIKDNDPITGKLRVYTGMPGYDIMKVYQGNTTSKFLDFQDKGDLIWEYKEPVAPTEADILREQMKVLKARLRELGEE